MRTFPIVAPLESLVERKIRSFRDLPLGWRYGEGGPPSDLTVQIALTFCRQLYQLGLTHVDAFPGAGGEIMLGVYKGEHYLEVMLESDQTISIAYELRDSLVANHPGLTEVEGWKVIQELAKTICNTSDLFIRESMIGTANASPAWHLKTHPTEEYQLSRWIVLEQPDGAYVPILGNSMNPELTQDASSFGSLIPPAYQLTAE